MLLIIAHHFAVHGGFDFGYESVTLNRVWTQFLSIGGKIGVNVFVLISGYFLIDKTTFNLPKIIRFWLQVFFYSISVYFIFVLCGKETFSIKEAIKSCLPISFQQWWFASTYFYMLMLAPFLSLVLHKLDRKLYFRLLVLFSFLWCIIPTFAINTLYIKSNNLLWFVYLYALAGYVKLHAPELSITGKMYIWAAVVMYLLIEASAIVFDSLGTKWTICADHATYFAETQKLSVLFVSVCLLLGFRKLKIRQNKWINIISSSTFGIYLIHDNDLIRKFLWLDLFRNNSFSESAFLIPVSLIAIAAVFAWCMFIELARKYTLEKLYMKWVNVLCDKVNQIIKLFYEHD